MVQTCLQTRKCNDYDGDAGVSIHLLSHFELLLTAFTSFCSSIMLAFLNYTFAFPFLNYTAFTSFFVVKSNPGFVPFEVLSTYHGLNDAYIA